jgi:hypothetical protein
MRSTALVVALVFLGCRYGSDAAALLDLHLDDAANHEHGPASHTHGDADDHHEDGDDSDCHHDHHCCCQHSSPLCVVLETTATAAGPVETADACDRTPMERIDARLIFHPPIA